MSNYSEKISHLVVLMLENRSFDHLLGYLAHPNPAFEGLRGKRFTNPWWPGKPAVEANDGAEYVLHPGPDHTYESVMRQMLGMEPAVRPPLFPKPYAPVQRGFVWDYERYAWEQGFGHGRGAAIMACFKPSRIPVLATLALEYAVCDHWHCSVPGATWPNRLYAHAGTSDGTVNNEVRFYFTPTIFELLSRAKRSWAIYKDGIAQSQAYPKLWARGFRNRFKSMDKFYRAARLGRLPNYAFIEPNHGIVPGTAGRANNQHPGNISEAGADFVAAEELVRHVYDAITENPEAWTRTLLVITYDEHGGFFDHIPPPTDASPPKSGETSREGFAFDMLGPRVPTVLVSPFIRKGTIDSNNYDHASIVATVRTVFAKDEDPLTKRDASARPFHQNLALSKPRAGRVKLTPPPRPRAAKAVRRHAKRNADKGLDDFQRSLVKLAALVEAKLLQEAGTARLARRGITRKRPAGAAAIVKSSAALLERSALPTVQLRTVTGDAIDRPRVADLRKAWRQLVTASEPRAKLCLIDGNDAAVVVQDRGRIVLFEDPREDKPWEGKQCDETTLLRCFTLLGTSNYSAIRELLARPSRTASQSSGKISVSPWRGTMTNLRSERSK